MWCVKEGLLNGRAACQTTDYGKTYFINFFITLLMIIYQLWTCRNYWLGVTVEPSKIITVTAMAFNSLSVRLVEPEDTNKFLKYSENCQISFRPN